METGTASAGKPLNVGGFVPLTTIDFPRRLAAIIFTQGCPWRCSYCQNPHLLPRKAGSQPWDAVIGFLKRRRNLLDGVVFSGGEPTAQRGLLQAVDAVHGLGFEVALHTSGAYPKRLQQVLPRFMWVGFDVKAPQNAYREITGVAKSGRRAFQSLDLLLASGVSYECRTTVDWRLITPDEVACLAHDLQQRGVQNFVVQLARSPTHSSEDASPGRAPSESEQMSLWSCLKCMFPAFAVRGVATVHRDVQ